MRCSDVNDRLSSSAERNEDPLENNRGSWRRRRQPTVGIGGIYWEYLWGMRFHAFAASGL